MRSSVESNIGAVEVKTVLASWHEERHVREMSYYITRCITKASFLQDFLVEDFGGRDLVIWVLRRRVVIVRLFFVMGGTLPENLTIRVSASMVGRKPPTIEQAGELTTSTVSYNESERKCPAYAQNGACNGPAELQRVKALIEAGPGTSKASRARHAKAVRDLARWDLSRSPVDCDACWRRDVPNVDYPLH